jgi:hypothetical protein
METAEIWRRARLGALFTVAAVVSAVIFAPTDLVQARGQLLQGIVGAYGGDKWTVAVSPTNGNSASNTADPAAIALALSTQTSAQGMATVIGPASTTFFGEAEVSYSGDWDFQWHPDNSTDWPPDYTITCVQNRIYHSSARNGTGTAHVLLPDTTELVSATVPTSTTGVSSTAPLTTVVVDTTDPNLTITTRTKTFRVTRTDATSASDVYGETIVTQRAYKAAWFPANFMTPASILLSFTVTPVDVTARTDFSAADDTGSATADVTASESYYGQ